VSKKLERDTHEPFIRMSKRDGMPLWKSLGVRLIGLVLALIVCAIIIYALTKLNPLKVYAAMFKGAFGTNKRIWVTIRDIMMLLCIAVGLAPAFKMRFWNIGAEGQILVGGLAAAACMIYLGKSITGVVLLIVMFLGSLLAGGVWGTIPAVFKARWNANETLFTLMMNYIAIQLTSFFDANTVGIINQMTKSGWFPSIFGQMYTLNVIIVMALAIIMFLYLRYAKHGYEIAVVGESENTARYAAINVRKVIVRTMALSGAICGIAGFIAVAGASHTISTSTAGGRGFTAIIVAWLAKFNTFVMIAISALLVFLQKGAIEIASQFDLNDFVSEMITGIILFFILGSEFFINYRLRFRGGRKEADK
jgi:simple sugar transport system permease protein